MSEFKVGDKVKLKEEFSNPGNSKEWKTCVTISRIENIRVYAKETGSWINKNSIEHVKGKDMTKWTETKTVIKDNIDKSLSGLQLISVKPLDSGAVRITVGAYYKDSCANWFTKEGIEELIKVLEEVKESM